MAYFSRWLKTALILALLSLTSVAGWFYHTQARELQEDAENDLITIAQLKTNQIVTWRNERLGDAGILAEDRFLASAVARWLADPLAVNQEEILARFRSVQKYYHYQDIRLVTPNGQIRLSLSGTPGTSIHCHQQTLSEIQRTRKPIFANLQIDQSDQKPHISMIAPIFSSNAQNQKLVALIILINHAEEFLYPLIQSWPKSSQTAETLLVQRDGDDVLFLNDLRHRSDTALKLRIPLTQTDVPAVMAIQGQTGIVKGKDYRGVDVVSIIQPIPDSPWYMIAKVDATEAFATWRFRSVIILAMFITLATLVVVSLLVLWQRDQKAHYQRLYQSEAALQENERLYQTLFDHAPIGVLTTTSSGRPISVNPAMAHMLGFSSPQDCLAHHTDLATQLYVNPTKRDALLQLLNETGIVSDFEFEANRTDGQTIWLNLNARIAKRNEDGSFVIEGFAADITKRKRAEREQGKLQTQLIQAQKMESVGRLAGGVAHDFNNILSAIMGYTQLVLRQLEPSNPLHADITEIHRAGQRATDLTRQLLAFARRQTIAPEVLDLNETVEGLLKMLRRLIGEDIDLAWLPGPGLWPVKMDPSQIDQILANLTVNARDAIEGVGKVTIETENVTLDAAYCANHVGFMPGEYVMLSMSDDGCGIDKDDMAHLFEPFFTTKATGQGTGLGLATVYGIVKQNDGFINIYSEPGEGTTVRIYLSRSVSQNETQPEDAEGKMPQGGSETVLLVEDDATVLKLSQKILEELGYTVCIANTPTEAIRLAEEHTRKIHLLITDVVMPEMNGRDLAAKLQARYPDLKILFMSGYTANVIAHHGVLDEEVMFIPKPFSMEALASKVREALAHS